MGITQPSDAELLARLRSGDGAAFALLRERYARPVGRLATDGAAPAGYAPLDAVPEGLRGEPPDGGDAAERAAALDAYAGLPDRARAVLWLTEVEGLAPGAVAPLLGMGPAAATALVSRAREQLRHAYLRAHLRASPRPVCGRPLRSGLTGRASGAGRFEVRTAATAHVEECRPCQALMAAVDDAPRLFARALAPWCAPGNAAPVAVTSAAVSSVAAAPPPTSRAGSTPGPGRGSGHGSGPRPARVLAAAGRRGRHAVATARGDPALTGTLAVAAALVLAVLATAVLPGRPPADTASPRPTVVDEGEVARARPPAPSPDSPPGTSMPGPAEVRPADPETASAPPSGHTAPHRPPIDGTVAPPARTAPPAAAPPTTAAGPLASPPGSRVQTDTGASPGPAGDPVVGAASAPSVPAVSSAVWRSARSRVEVTLVNSGAASTGFLVVTLEAAGGALVDAQPRGCALAVGMFTSGMCTLRPLGPGASAVVQVPMTVTRPGQSAEVQVCAVAFLRLSCATPLFSPTVVALV